MTYYYFSRNYYYYVIVVGFSNKDVYCYIVMYISILRISPFTTDIIVIGKLCVNISRMSSAQTNAEVVRQTI